MPARQPGNRMCAISSGLNGRRIIIHALVFQIRCNEPFLCLCRSTAAIGARMIELEESIHATGRMASSLRRRRLGRSIIFQHQKPRPTRRGSAADRGQNNRASKPTPVIWLRLSFPFYGKDHAVLWCSSDIYLPPAVGSRALCAATSASYHAANARPMGSALHTGPFCRGPSLLTMSCLAHLLFYAGLPQTRPLATLE